ncbi:MAG: RecX family transcriptional regulator [Bacteroidetes bacterium]|nr:RecX family transcriptional regulator [Bacteroidota bacterium]
MNEKNNFHELLIKAERFCAYQERCSYEVKQKLKELGAGVNETEAIILSLQEDDFQNDERFARLFTSGKFRIKRWGKNKICAELRMRHIPDSFIKKGLDAINEEDYLKTLKELAKKKEREVKSKNLKDKNQKIGMFLLSKGFESELIWKALKSPSHWGEGLG